MNQSLWPVLLSALWLTGPAAPAWGQNRSLLIGGAQPDEAVALARDGAGAIYVAGTTYSADLASLETGLSRRPQKTLYPGDVFVQKMNSAGVVLWRAVFGGAHRDQAAAVAVDAGGNVYVAGTTVSLDFPLTEQAFRKTDRSRDSWTADAFAVKLSPDGARIIYSTLYGGNEADEATAIAVDSQGQAVLAGITFSDDLPTSPQALQRQTCGGFGYDGFAAKLSAHGDRLIFGTYICGSGHDRVRAMALARDSTIYLAGETRSADFPVTQEAAQKEPAGEWDGFVMRLTDQASSAVFSTRIGGPYTERIGAVLLLPDWRVAVGGEAWRAAMGFQDGFVSLVDSRGREVLWTARVGGAMQDAVTSLEFDGTSVLAGGWTRSRDWLGEGRPEGGEDGFVARFTLSGEAAGAAALGGSGRDQVKALLSAPGGWIAAGQTGEPQWLTSETPGGQGDGFVVWGTTASAAGGDETPPVSKLMWMRAAEQGGTGRMAFEGLPADPEQRWLVELHGEPAVQRPKALQSVRAAQSRMRERLAAEGGRVYGAVDTVANVLFAAMDGELAAKVRQWPEVKRVTPSRAWRPDLDAALQIHRIIQAWDQMGGEEAAGRGIKIGIIDTGIDQNHPALAPGGLEMPPGFPRANSEADLKLTSNKVIVARGYEPFNSPSARDVRGHGTAVAVTAAGGWAETSIGWVIGPAPKAWLGNYNVFGPNERCWDEQILLALEDAVLDGMDVINMSLGGDGNLLNPEDDIFTDVAQRVASLGVILVKSAGNDGPTWGSLGSMHLGEWALRVGNHLHGRQLLSRLIVDGTRYEASPAAQVDPATAAPVQAPLADLNARFPGHLGCESIAAGTFPNQIVLVDRGTCTFGVKARNLAGAGAVAMVVVNHAGQDPFSMSLGAEPALPAAMIRREDGDRLRSLLREAPEPPVATLSWPLETSAREGDGMNSSSSGGPAPEGGIAPDLSAVGSDVWTGDLKGGFSPTSGTSFSAPLVAGSAALLVEGRPGLPFEHYRSLLMNTARPLIDGGSGLPLPLNRQGAGSLNLESAMRSAVTVHPATVSFGGVKGNVEAKRSVALFNLSPEPLTCAALVEPARGVAVMVSPEAVALDGGGTAELAMTMKAEQPAPGQHEGYVRLDCGGDHPPVRIPYWMGVTTGKPAGMKRTALTSSGKAGQTLWNAARYRIWDEAGLPLNNHPPEVTVELGGGEVVDVWKSAFVFPGQYAIHVRPAQGRNVFRVRFGEISETFEVQGNP